jgi:hypothetical protein
MVSSGFAAGLGFLLGVGLLLLGFEARRDSELFGAIFQNSATPLQPSEIPEIIE